MWFAKRGADLRNAKGLRVHRMEQRSATRQEVDHSQPTRLPCASRAAQARHWTWLEKEGHAEADAGLKA